MSLIRFLTQRGYEYWLIAKKDIQRGDHLMWFYGKHYEHGFKLSDIQDLLDR